MKLDLFIIGYGRPDLLPHQIRLLRKYLKDPFDLCLVDNTPGDLQFKMQQICSYSDVGYMRVPEGDGSHPSALNHAAKVADEIESEYWGTLDHDVFPTKRCAILKNVKKSGFYGLGQTYKTRVGDDVRHYLWPGWSFWSSAWLDGRIPDFEGIRNKNKWDDGDAGSLLHSLFTREEWENRVTGTHNYGDIREVDGHGLQSHGYEIMDDSWIHFTNSSHWKAVPDPEERDARLLALLEAA